MPFRKAQQGISISSHLQTAGEQSYSQMPNHSEEARGQHLEWPAKSSNWNTCKLQLLFRGHDIAWSRHLLENTRHRGRALPQPQHLAGSWPWATWKQTLKLWHMVVFLLFSAAWAHSNKLAFVLSYKTLTCCSAALGVAEEGWGLLPGAHTWLCRSACLQGTPPARCKCLALFPSHNWVCREKYFVYSWLESANKQGEDLRRSFKAIPTTILEIISANHLEMKKSHFLQAPVGI